MAGGVVLMIRFGGIEGGQGIDRGYDGPAEDAGGGELADVTESDAALFRRAVKDHGAILATDIRALPIRLGWILDHREKDLEQAAERDAPGIVDHAHGLGVGGATARDILIIGGRGAAAGVTGGGGDDAADVGVDGLHAPKTSASEND
jgi:hypothetical protein